MRAWLPMIYLLLTVAVYPQDGEWRQIPWEWLALIQNGNYPAAKVLVEEALARGGHEGDLERTGTLLWLSANTHFALGDPEAADQRYRAAISALERAAPAGALALVRAKVNYAGLIDSRGQHLQAQRLRLEALRLAEGRHGDRSPEYLTVMSELAGGFYTSKDYSRAETIIGEVIAACERGSNPRPITAANSFEILGYLRLDTRRLPEAIEAFEKSESIYEEKFGTRHPVLLNGWLGQAAAHIRLQQFDQAETLLRRAEDTARSSLGSGHHLHLMALQGLSQVLRMEGRIAEAKALERSIKTLSKSGQRRKYTVSWAELFGSKR